MISIVVPTFNRGKNIAATKEAIQHVMSANAYDYEIIFVDDGSVDQTEAILRGEALKSKKVKGIILDGNYGQQNATLAGLRRAVGEVVFTIDDDFSCDVKVIPSMIETLKEGADVVYGVPPESHKQHLRRFGTVLKEWVFVHVCHKPKTIRLTSFKGMSREVVEYIVQDCSNKVYISARILQRPYVIKNVPAFSEPFAFSTSGYNLFKLIKLLFEVIIYYSESTVFKTLRKKSVCDQYNIKNDYNFPGE